MSAHLVKGDDPILRSDALDAVVAELLGSDDRTLALEDHTVPGRSSDGEPGGADVPRRRRWMRWSQAAQSPPFMTAVRVVVLRDIGNLLAGDVGPLTAYLADPLDTTELVFVAGGGKVPDALAKALKEAKAVEHGAARSKVERRPRRRARGYGRRAAAGRGRSAHHTRSATKPAECPAIVEVLTAAYPSDARLTADDVAPYLGEAGGVAPYLLTNAIERRRRRRRARDCCTACSPRRGPQQPKPMHPLQMLAMLHN